MSSLILGKSLDDGSQSSLIDGEEKCYVKHMAESSFSSSSHNRGKPSTTVNNRLLPSSKTNSIINNSNKAKFADLVEGLLGHQRDTTNPESYHPFYDLQSQSFLINKKDKRNKTLTLSTDSLITKLKEEHFHQPTLRCNSESDLSISQPKNNTILSGRHRDLILTTLDALTSTTNVELPQQQQQLKKTCRKTNYDVRMSIQESSEEILSYLRRMADYRTSSQKRQSSSNSNFSLTTNNINNNNATSFYEVPSHLNIERNHFVCSKCLKIRVIDESFEEENLDHYREWTTNSGTNPKNKLTSLSPNKFQAPLQIGMDNLDKTIIRNPIRINQFNNNGMDENKSCFSRNNNNNNNLIEMKKLRSNSLPFEQQTRIILGKNEIGYIKEIDNEEEDFENDENNFLLENSNRVQTPNSSTSHFSRRKSSLLLSENSMHQQFPMKPFHHTHHHHSVKDEIPVMTRIRRASMIFNSTLMPNDEKFQANNNSSDHILSVREDEPMPIFIGQVNKAPTNASPPSVGGNNNTLLKKFHPERKESNRQSDHSPMRFRRKSKVARMEIDNVRESISRKSQPKNTAVVRHQLGRRRKLIERRRHLADFSLFFALFGIFVMFIDAELVFTQIITTSDVYSNSLRSLISFSTIILILLICLYHAYDIMVFSCDDCIEDWRIAVDYWRVLQIIFEVMICLLHPIPGFHWHNPVPSDFAVLPSTNSTPFKSPTTIEHIVNNSNNRTSMVAYRPRCEQETVELPLIRDYNIYLCLSLPMISRLYLILRVLLLHGKMFNDAGSRSIGAMNKISFDVRFVLKTLMTIFPGTVLLIIIMTCWIVMTWTMRACERRQIDQPDLYKCGWLIAVTFLSIGYGDIVPVTQCGKIIAISCGLMGSACTALVVAVFSRKLELSKAEKYVIHFMTSNKLTKNMKYYAANVLRETWFIYKNTKLTKNVNPARVRLHQRKFLRAIHGLRQMKVMQRELQDESNSLVDFTKLQANVFETVVAVSLRQDCIQRRMENLESILSNIRELVQRKLA